MMSKLEVDTLEALIDRRGLSEVLLTLGAICSDKADHVRQYADSEGLSASWDMAGDVLGTVACSSQVQSVTP